MLRRGGAPLRFAILGVILNMKMHPALYWCYTVESLVINKELVQTNLLNFLFSTEPSITCAVLKSFQLFYFCLLFFCWFYSSTCCFPLILPVSSTSYTDSLKLRKFIMVERIVFVFSYMFYSNNSFLFVYECNSERQ